MQVSPDTGYKGDNDPIDCVEIGTKQSQCGDVVVVRVLGVLAMIDEGETDWKLITIRNDDPLASTIRTHQDLIKHMPGAIEGIVEWFTYYKSLKNGTKNEWALNGVCQDEKYAKAVIEETHHYWKDLVGDKEKAKSNRRTSVCALAKKMNDPASLPSVGLELTDFDDGMEPWDGATQSNSS